MQAQLKNTGEWVEISRLVYNDGSCSTVAPLYQFGEFYDSRFYKGLYNPGQVVKVNDTAENAAHRQQYALVVGKCPAIADFGTRMGYAIMLPDMKDDNGNATVIEDFKEEALEPVSDFVQIYKVMLSAGELINHTENYYANQFNQFYNNLTINNHHHEN
jgi:hypothetical protein